MKIISTHSELNIDLEEITLKGDFNLPHAARGLVIFSHGSGSSRMSPRNRAVAKFLQQEGLATLLFDLLTPEEDRNYRRRFDIELLTDRLIAVTKWVQLNPMIQNLKVGYFGASTGAASALNAAATLGYRIAAVVSRGGRPDLAFNGLSRVIAPTLLIVGSLDLPVIEFNQLAFAQLKCEKELKIVPGASHLFEEHGKLEEVASLTAAWFNQWF